jgi:3-hydroxyacyl-CoA dehydrogenase / enoyl-CoA hydratase / 3-hydroxybutyryl-CoA epimerase
MKTNLLHTTDGGPGDAFIPSPPTPLARTRALRHFHLETDADGTAWITFDMEGTAANVWNDATLHEFDLCLEAVTRDPSLKSLVIRSAKPGIFIAGADLHTLRHAPAHQLEQLVGLGQRVFNRLAALPLHKIALIQGACLGGGLELALACDTRLASDEARLGLPETQLGLIPAWGGSTRLPRLLGLPAALDLIVSGRQLKAAAARRAGLIDEVAPREHLERAAYRRIAYGPPRRPAHRPFSLLPGLRQFIARRARLHVLTRTRGQLAAPLRAITVAARAAVAPLEQAMELERHAILDLALTPAAGHLIDLFFRREEANKKTWPRGIALPVHEVAVIGAGVMGAGIAHWLTLRGVRVLLQDVAPDALARGLARVHGLLHEGRRRGSLDARARREAADRLVAEHLPVPLTRPQIILEAATEDMALKKRIFEGLAARCGPDTVLATNTSALSVTELADSLPHPERVIGLHFFNPVHRMPLVEIVTTRHTSDDVIATAVGFVQKLGKTPLVVRDSPGFVVNRVLMPYLMEAVRLHEQGIPAETIDEAMRRHGMPMGPLRLLDEIGLDVAAHVGRTLAAAWPERLATSPLLDRQVATGKLGRKSGEGFYRYHGRRPHSHRHHDPAQLAEVLRRLPPKLTEEAERCAREGVAASPEAVDLALVLGAGYPAWHGGPLARQADGTSP